MNNWWMLPGFAAFAACWAAEAISWPVYHRLRRYVSDDLAHKLRVAAGVFWATCFFALSAYCFSHV